VEKKESKGNC